MPRRRPIHAALDRLIRAQDWVIHRDQAIAHGHSTYSIAYLMRTGAWRPILPETYLCHPGEPSRRQLMIAALLYAGPNAAIDGIDACRFHGIRAIAPAEDAVQVVIPWADQARTRDFLVVRRTTASIDSIATDRLRYLAAPAAVIAAARRLRSERAVLALISDAIQRRIASHDELVRAHIQGSPHHARLTDKALAALSTGAHSAPEAEFLTLIDASLILPAPTCNARLRLPTGQIVSPDALWEDAGLVHETNGRTAHARADLFEDMQARHDAMTAAGLTVMHNTPRRLAVHGRQVVTELERCYLRLAGQGLPAGIQLLGLAS